MTLIASLLDLHLPRDIRKGNLFWKIEKKKANGIATTAVLISDIPLHLGMNCIFIEYICMWAEMPSGKELTLKERGQGE